MDSMTIGYPPERAGHLSFSINREEARELGDFLNDSWAWNFSGVIKDLHERIDQYIETGV